MDRSGGNIARQYVLDFVPQERHDLGEPMAIVSIGSVLKVLLAELFFPVPVIESREEGVWLLAKLGSPDHGLGLVVNFELLPVINIILL